MRTGVGMSMIMRMLMSVAVNMSRIIMNRIVGMIIMMDMSMRIALVMPMHMIAIMDTLLPFGMSMKVFHIMIPVFMGSIQYHMEITGIDPGFYHPGHFNLKSLHRKAVQRPFKHVSVRPQIQKRSHCHIAAYPRAAFQI